MYNDERFRLKQNVLFRVLYSAGILEQSMGARNRVGIGLSYRLTELILLIDPGLLISLKIQLSQSIHDTEHVR
jgi:hypothetical protein